MNRYTLTIILSLFALTVITRALPFMFARILADNAKIKVVGRRLTAYIMMLLVIYEVNPASFEIYPYGLPAVLSLIVVVVTHLCFHKPFLSMTGGTISFILLQQWFSL